MKKTLLFLLAASALSASAQTTFTAGVLNYTVTGENSVEVSGLADNTVTVLDIPASVENDGITYDVKAIGDQAFRWAGVKSVTLPASIDSIKHGGFNGSDLMSITLNEGLRYIGDYALACKQLITIDIPSTVEVIDDNAFFAASNLSQINFNEGLKKIGKSAFYNTSLARVEIPATVDTIGNTAFLYCRKLVSANIVEGSLRYLGDGAFNGCTLLETIQLPSTLEYIGMECFLGNVKLTTMNIPAGVTHLGESFMAKTAIANIDLDPANATFKLVDGVLYNMYGNVLMAVPMKGKTAVDIPAGVQAIYGGAFWGSEVANVTLPDGLMDIEDYAFCQSALATIEFPASLVWVGEQAFAATQLTHVVLPENFPYINDGEFAGCTQLMNVHIPSSVLEVYPHAFQNCNKATFYAHGSKAPVIMDFYDDWDHPFYGTGGIVYVPKGAKGSYQSEAWHDELTIKETEVGTLLPVDTNPANNDVISVQGNQAAPVFAISFDQPVELIDEAPQAFVRKNREISTTAMLPDQPWTATLIDGNHTLIVSRNEAFDFEEGIDYYFTLPEGVVKNEAGEVNEHIVIVHQYALEGTPHVSGDVNEDGNVDIDDVNIVINIMLEQGALMTLDNYPYADLDGNGVVDVDDLNAVINILLAQ